MELQGLSLLLDLKISIKKKLYRHAINQVERKFEKDYSFISKHHLVLILLKQIEAVHGLLNDATIGQVEKKVDKIEKLIKIMNRNIRVVRKILETHMSRHMVHLNNQNIQNELLQSQTYLPQIQKNIKYFFTVLLKTYYYLYLLGITSENRKQETFQSQIILTNKCKSILDLLITSQKHSCIFGAPCQSNTYQESQMKQDSVYKIKPNKNKNYSLKSAIQQQITIIKMILLLMGIDIRYGNYEQAKQQFYQTVTLILKTIKLSINHLQKRRRRRSRVGADKKQKQKQKKQKQRKLQKSENTICQLYILLTIALLNNQRMLIETDSMKGWEAGVQILKRIEKQYRFQHCNWNKYIRTQYENYQYISKNKNYYQQIRLVFAPYIVHESELIKSILNSMNCHQLSNNKINQLILHTDMAKHMKFYSLSNYKNSTVIQNSQDKNNTDIKASEKQNKYTNYNNFKQRFNASRQLLTSRQKNKLCRNTNRSEIPRQNFQDKAKLYNIREIQRDSFKQDEDFFKYIQKPVKKKRNLKLGKNPSIDWLYPTNHINSQLQNSIPLNNFQNRKKSDFILNNSKDTYQEGDQKRKSYIINNNYFLGNQKQNLRRKKKKTLNIQKYEKDSTILSQHQLQYQKDKILKINKQITKERKKQLALHRLISEQKYLEVDNTQSKRNCVSNNKVKYLINIPNINGSTKIYQNKESNQKRKSIQINFVQALIQLLIKNKKRLRINMLVDKYQLVKKRKKQRNYQNQIIQIQLQKNIAQLIVTYSSGKLSGKGKSILPLSVSNMPNKNPITPKQPQNNKYFSVMIGNKSTNIPDNQNPHEEYKSVTPSSQQILQYSHHKSKQVIRQMLKKITVSSNKKSKLKKIIFPSNLNFQPFFEI